MSAEEYTLTIRETEPEEDLTDELAGRAEDEDLRHPGEDEIPYYYEDELNHHQERLLAQFDTRKAEILADPTFPTLLAAHGMQYRGLAADPAAEEPVIHPQAPEIWLEVQAAQHAFGELEFSPDPAAAEDDRWIIASEAVESLLRHHTNYPDLVDFANPETTQEEMQYSFALEKAKNLLTERFAVLGPFAEDAAWRDNSAEILVALNTYDEENSRQWLATLFYMEAAEKRDQARAAAAAAGAAPGENH